MNKKIFYGLTLTAVLAMAVAFPAVADAISSGIEKTKVKQNDDGVKRLKFHLNETVPETPFGGYAIFTDDGAVIAITSHAGFFDSIGQQAPTTSQVALQAGAIAAVCTESEDVCGNDWHSHLVIPAPQSLCSNVSPEFQFAVSELSYNQPTDRLKIAGENILARGIDKGTEGFVGAVSGQLMNFTVGYVNATTTAAFDLVPVNSTGGIIEEASQLADGAICIVPSQ